MPFMVGPGPVRRTAKYLEAGKIIFRENVKIFSAHYSRTAENHKGAREFIFWHLDQIQYKNPGVQCITFNDLVPSPFFRIYLDNAKDLIINLDCRDKYDIMNHMLNFTAICKTPEEQNTKKESTLIDDSLFGVGCKRHCMCEILGQVPCPNLVNLPTIWKKGGKFKPEKLYIPFYYSDREIAKTEEEEEEAN